MVTKNGQIVGLKVGNDVLVSEKDLATSDKGSRSWEGWVNEVHADYKPSKEGALAFMAKDNPNSAIANAWTNHVKEYGNLALIQQRLAALNHFKDYYKETGSISSKSHIAGGGEVQWDSDNSLLGKLVKWTLGGKIAAKIMGSLSRDNIEKMETSLLNYTIAGIQTRALKAATIGGKVNWDIFREEYQEGMHHLFKDIQKITTTKGHYDFGASSPFAFVTRQWKDQAAFISDPKRFIEQMEAGTQKMMKDSGLDNISNVFSSYTQPIALGKEFIKKTEKPVSAVAEVLTDLDRTLSGEKVSPKIDKPMVPSKEDIDKLKSFEPQADYGQQ